MGTYPMKVLIDEHNNEFVPWVSADCIHTNDGLSFEEKFATKIDSSNLKEGKGITITKDGADCTFDVDFGAGDNIIDNLDTTVAGQGPLDARQGNILKNMIPTIVDNLTTADPNKVLSANQGVELKKIAVPEGGSAGQVLKKATDDNHSLEWGDAADPNAIVGNGSIMKIIELTYAEYKTLESNGELQEDTEYHITDVENGTASYMTEEQIQKQIENNVVDNVETTSPVQSLSANQGKIINDRLNSLDTRANSSLQCIATVFADGTSNKLELTNLNLKPGSLYEIVYAEWSSESTSQGHVMRLNGIASGYQGIHVHPAGMESGVSGNTLRVMNHYNCLAYVNGWDLGRDLAYGSYMLYYFNHDWITVTGQSHIVPHPGDKTNDKLDGQWNMIWEQGSYNGHNVQTIDSISIETLDSSTIGSGSYLKIYSR